MDPQAEHKIDYYDCARAHETWAIREWVSENTTGDFQDDVTEWGMTDEGDLLHKLQLEMESDLGGLSMNFPSWLCEEEDPEDNTTHEDVGVLYDALVDTYNIDLPETESE